ncbi:hypothetical protein KPH14_007889 [Odynerus spinipes]|uniref:Uncharacterized protein n=1 Tax=Odynerus spinipes TaxID=1348599 RepID=A0AAD9S0K1_9HYME|nr:hypothetical protein KPH14_007889 [Odynerus spinipes]
MKPNETGMTLPISSYEKLLDQVRELTHETRLLQRDLHSALYNANIPPDVNHNFPYERRDCKKGKILGSSIIWKDEKRRKTEDEQGPLVECNNLRPRPRFVTNLDSTDYLRSRNLTSRLLAQRSYEHARLISQDGQFPQLASFQIRVA